ncbi:hypothetical protein HMPREF9714_02966 [Myroides odoratimimus CCUG 12901]|uniref:Uncharacterized protein n=2 Tax=Myroides odoratimimus TaxID=76832 RepID=A0ABP2N7Z9_9FLAO|nr:hypothetical protein MYRA21_0435 [Myroides sp. A21]EHO05811.1 hypothetical protein HMPREF9712_03387 [Myroides odoratimimus CCUG 10230]EHO06327.1 hypothetical protein HMPREF9715_03048 [Myroides odoratimimus CIP 101113]EHO06486.1 hypothetical protein HMPREF9714_02966 [Myroides odoratimimus CCUG 12901]EKB02277.1 hypothetical protein HMPREF9711_03483 [Myroides odoratimimus CCUG 3837]STZ49759.1 Uncharacterised protein [Myroides odoratimimus]
MTTNFELKSFKSVIFNIFCAFYLGLLMKLNDNVFFYKSRVQTTLE